MSTRHGSLAVAAAGAAPDGGAPPGRHVRRVARSGAVGLVLTAALVTGLTGCGRSADAGAAGGAGGAAHGSTSGGGDGSTVAGAPAGSPSGAAGTADVGSAASSGASSSPAATDVAALQQAVDQAGTLADQVDQDLAGDSGS